jgi:hypothetical protein
MPGQLKTAVVSALVGAVAASATVALAGSGVGGVFNLGQTNTVNQPSVLAGTTAGNQAVFYNASTAPNASGGAAFGKSATAPALRAQNLGSGPALGLSVAAGHAPFTVDSATKVTNLNADRLDGLDQSTFLRTNGKAADSDKLDGFDQSSFLHATGKAADSDKLDGFDSTAFPRTGGVGSTKILTNRIVRPPEGDQNIHLLDLPGLGYLKALCFNTSADIYFVNTSGTAVDFWRNTTSDGKTHASFLADGSSDYIGYGVHGVQTGETFGVGYGGDNFVPRAALVQFNIFQVADLAPCGFQATATVWSA